MLDVKEVAKQLHVSVSMVYGLIQRGELKSYRIGRCVRVTVEHVNEYLEQCKQVSGKTAPRTNRLRHINL